MLSTLSRLGICSVWPVAARYPKFRSVKVRDRYWTIGLLGFGLGVSLYTAHTHPVSVTTGSIAQPSVSLSGEVNLVDPVEPVRELLVDLQGEPGSIGVHPSQVRWPANAFQLDLQEGRRYAFEGIAVVVEPQDDALEAAFVLRPRQSFVLGPEGKHLRFDLELRPVDVEFREVPDVPGRIFSVDASAQLDDVEILSRRVWRQGEGARESTTLKRRVWVPKGRSVELRFTFEPEDPSFGGMKLRWTQSLDVHRNHVITALPDARGVQGRFALAGNSQPLIPGSRLYLRGPGQAERFGRMGVDGTYRLLRPEANADQTFEVQPMFMFQDGSSTMLSQRAMRFESKRGPSLMFDLHAREAEVQMESSFEIDRVQLSLAKGLGRKDAQATREVRVRESQSGKLRAGGTFQLEPGAWNLGGLALAYEQSDWWTRYQIWESGLREHRTHAERHLDLGFGVNLAHATIPADAHTPTPAYISEPTVGKDVRGQYLDALRSRGQTLVGRAGRRYRMMVDAPESEQQQYAFDVRFGYTQPVSAGGPAYVGAAPSAAHRCDGVELLYKDILSDGAVLINRFTQSAPAPTGFGVWPESTELFRSVDVQRSFVVGSEAPVTACMQYDTAELARAGLEASDLMLAYRVQPIRQAPELAPAKRCPKGGLYLPEGWCVMPRASSKELEPFLTHRPETPCAWSCASGQASRLSQMVFLRR